MTFGICISVFPLRVIRHKTNNCLFGRPAVYRDQPRRPLRGRLPGVGGAARGPPGRAAGVRRGRPLPAGGAVRGDGRPLAPPPPGAPDLPRLGLRTSPGPPWPSPELGKRAPLLGFTGSGPVTADRMSPAWGTRPAPNGWRHSCRRATRRCCPSGRTRSGRLAQAFVFVWVTGTVKTLRRRQPHKAEACRQAERNMRVLGKRVTLRPYSPGPDAKGPCSWHTPHHTMPFFVPLPPLRRRV